MDEWIWTSAQAKEANYGHSSCFAAAGSSDVASAFQSDPTKRTSCKVTGSSASPTGESFTKFGCSGKGYPINLQRWAPRSQHWLLLRMPSPRICRSWKGIGQIPHICRSSDDSAVYSPYKPGGATDRFQSGSFERSTVERPLWLEEGRRESEAPVGAGPSQGGFLRLSGEVDVSKNVSNVLCGPRSFGFAGAIRRSWESFNIRS